MTQQVESSAILDNCLIFNFLSAVTARQLDRCYSSYYIYPPPFIQSFPSHQSLLTLPTGTEDLQ